MKVAKSKPLYNLKDICNYIMERHKIHRLDQECFVMISLDFNYRVIKSHLIALGGLNEAKPDLKVIFNRLFKDKAARFVVAHNHPNGNDEFSEGDLRLTIAISMIADMIECDLLDHILFPALECPVAMSNVHKFVFHNNWRTVFSKTVEKYTKNVGLL